MIKKLMTAAAVCAALSGGVAHASTFAFTYTFADTQEITGSFTGTSTNGGQSVTNISNLQVALDGIAFTGGASPALILNSWNPTVANTSGYGPANGAWNPASTPVTHLRQRRPG